MNHKEESGYVDGPDRILVAGFSYLATFVATSHEQENGFIGTLRKGFSTNHLNLNI